MREGWDKQKIGALLKVETGSKNAEDSSEDGIYPFFTRAETTQKIDKYSYDTEALFIAGEGHFRVKYYEGKFEVHQRTYMLTARDKKNTYLPYLQKAIQPKIAQLINTSVGSTVMSLRKPIIEAIELLIPKSKKEQEKIAEILSEVDSAIEHAQALHVKHQKIKTALMQDLLTHGIDQYGKIRNPKTQAYKPSPLGDIPAEWDVKGLIEVVDFLDHKRKPLKSTDRQMLKGVYPYYGASGIIDYINEPLANSTKQPSQYLLNSIF
jgi:type I restriction enzyme S subunit